MIKQLPDSLKRKVAQNQYSKVIQLNISTFRSCNALFLEQLLTKMREMYLMPKELLIRSGDMARELAFVLDGVMEVEKDGAVIRRIRSDTEAPTVCGDIAFFMGVAQPYSLRASGLGDVTLVSFGKLEYEELLVSYPEQHDTIMTNLLQQYELDKNGNELSKAGQDEEDELFVEMKQKIKSALQKRNADALSEMTYAASVGDEEAVEILLIRWVAACVAAA